MIHKQILVNLGLNVRTAVFFIGEMPWTSVA